MMTYHIGRNRRNGGIVVDGRQFSVLGHHEIVKRFLNNRGISKPLNDLGEIYPGYIQNLSEEEYRMYFE
ncbi:MAG: hypothetical protein NTY20_00235 [Candidatus Aenigmarchaeota archaeon]|nr:hypothetical protein [Candidatus Aenigmarchaeota archaeon]